ncbi:MAG: LON peptidase substrate-binding domain-containing protein, partial [Armatimonadota bacterium]
MILPLHLFEERYKEMLAYCMDRESPFGIVMLHGVDVTSGEPTYHSVGCTAEFVRVDPTKDGRYNVHVAGEERFRVLDTHDGMSFRMAMV